MRGEWTPDILGRGFEQLFELSRIVGAQGIRHLCQHLLHFLQFVQDGVAIRKEDIAPHFR